MLITFVGRLFSVLDRDVFAEHEALRRAMRSLLLSKCVNMSFSSLGSSDR
jgi:hypothetical protein